MGVFKCKETGTWYVMTRYRDWKGERKQKCKRGFATKRAAQDWEQKFHMQNAADMDMTFEAFYEIYTKDMKARLKENSWITKQNIVETGLGFATDVGPHGRLKWTRPWVNAKGHSLAAQADVSAKEQEVDVSYKIPQSADPLKSYWLLQSGYKYTDLNDTQSSQLAVSGSHFRLLESGWTRQISINWLTDNFSQADVSTTSMVI